MLFIIIHSYCPAQTQSIYNKDLLLKTWKLESMTFKDGNPYFSKKDLPNELITFKKDSIWERKRGDDKLEAIWYFNDEGMLVIKDTKFNGIQTQTSKRKSFWKIKALDSNHLTLIYLEREGDNIIYSYTSYSGN